MKKVSLYIHQHSARKYKLTNLNTLYPLGTIFVLRYNGKFETLEGTPTFGEARVAAMQKQIELVTKGETKKPTLPKPVVKKPKEHLTLNEAIDKYANNLRIKSKATQSAYSLSLKLFSHSCGDKPMAEITKQDLEDFVNYLRSDGLSDRTVANRMVNIVTFLRYFGRKDIAIRVRYTEQKVRAYRPDELKALFAACTEDEWLMFQFFLCSGAREQEVMHATKEDIDFVDGLFTVREKEGWKPKDYEEREIPLPDFLLNKLKERKPGLLFPTPEGKPNGHMLRFLKAAVKRAKLPGVWKLHKFRKSYATIQHRDKVDARTIQKRLGHSSLETTLAYLEGEEARSERSRMQVNGAFGAFA